MNFGKLIRSLAGGEAASGTGGSRRIAFVGLAKNAGKTTALNAAADEIRSLKQELLIASIGRDGEARDAITGLAKPPVRLRRGDHFVTTGRFAGAEGLEAVLVRDLKISGALGRTALYRLISSEGAAVITGLNRLSGMRRLLEGLEDGRFTCLIDGAAGRRSIGMPEIADAVIISTGAVLGGGCAEVAARTEAVLRILTADEATEETYADPATAVIQGALTQRKAREAAARGAASLIAGDPTKIFITGEEELRLRSRGIRIFVKQSLRIAGVTINPHNPGGRSLDSAELQAAVEEVCGNLPVFNVKTG